MFILYLTLPWWVELVERAFYFRGYLSFVSLDFFRRIDFLLKSVFLIGLVIPIFRKDFNGRKIIGYVVLVFIILNCLFPQVLIQNGQAWRGKWIWAEKETNDQYVLFEKDFFWPGILPRTGIVDISAKSIYKLYINNQFVGEGPGPIDNRNRYYDHYDVGKYLVNGQNKIKILAYNFGHNTHFQREQNGGVLAQFFFGNGFVRFGLSTDHTWQVSNQTGWQRIDLATTGIKNFEINSGLYREEYRFTPVGPSFSRAVEHPILYSDNLIKRSIPYLVYEKVNPISVTPEERSTWFEFAKEMAGYPIFTFDIKRSGTLRARYIEDNNSSPVQEDLFTFDQAGSYSHRVFGRRGFRLVQVVWDSIGSDNRVGLVVDAIRFPAEKTGTFESSDRELEKIYVLGEDTIKYAAQDQLEDSFVHERSQYLGDAYVDMLSGFYSLNVARLARKALYQYSSTQRPDGIIETVYPSGLNQTILSYNLMFSSFLKDYYPYTGDLKTVRELLPAGEKIAFAVDKIRDEKGIISQQYYNRLSLSGDLVGWIDHVPEGASGPDQTIIMSALYYKELNALEYLFKEIGLNQRQNYYQQKKMALSSELSMLVQTRLRDKIDGRAAVILINSGALDSILEQAVYDASLRTPPRPFITGYFDFFYLLAMEKMGDMRGIRRVLNEQWGGMLVHGAHTTWEMYDPTVINFRPFSKAHAWSSGPTYFLPAYVVGVRPLAPAYQKILVKPLLLTSSASAKIKTPCGKIDVSWTKDNARFNLLLNKTCPGEVVFDLPFTKNQVISATINGADTTADFSSDSLKLLSAENQLTIKLELAQQ